MIDIWRRAVAHFREHRPFRFSPAELATLAKRRAMPEADSAVLEVIEATYERAEEVFGSVLQEDVIAAVRAALPVAGTEDMLIAEIHVCMRALGFIQCRRRTDGKVRWAIQRKDGTGREAFKLKRKKNFQPGNREQFKGAQSGRARAIFKR